ncbi:hypothetical protein [Tabrizicola soli]|uniref:Uncharacterized protein n=1 Tax=Tabrizicola soli TaxID=2185115 RepID=A0ABV7E1B7_9RHOB|nr:hypothetical protein [Tabrizicola soli]
MNRAVKRAQVAQKRKAAKTHDALARRIGAGLDTLRALASLESGIPAQFIGVAVEGEVVKIWDTRVAVVSIAPKTPSPVFLDEVDAEGFEPAVEGGAA